jgi:uncharacterized delta-60 repeat protein
MAIRARHMAATAAILGLLALATAPNAGATGPDFAWGIVAPGSGGTIVAVGRSFAVARLRLDGSRDTSFGRGGIAQAVFRGYAEARSKDAIVRRDGEVIVAGYVASQCEPPRGGECLRRLALARFTSSGRLDPTFGGDGIVVTRQGGQGLAIASSPGGRLVVAGRTAGGMPLVARFMPDGALDRGFGTGGLVTVRRLPEAGPSGQGRANAVSVQPDGGAIVAVGTGAPGGLGQGLVRLTSKGRIDPWFGDRGLLTALPSGVQFGESGDGLAPLPEGKLLVAATTTEYPRHIALVRLDSDGGVDESYGSDGVALGPRTFQVRFNVDVALQRDGKAVVAAAGFGASAATRFEPGGAVDLGFANDGITAPMESWGGRASVAILSDGSFAVADLRREASGLVVARYASDGTPLFAVQL